MKSYFSIITGTTFKKIEDEFYWSDYEEHDPNDFKSSNITWISAKEAKWRNASEWIGPTNRYGVNDQ